MRAWLARWFGRRTAEIDGQILRPAFEQSVRARHPEMNDVEVAYLADEMMQMHNRLEAR